MNEPRQVYNPRRMRWEPEAGPSGANGVATNPGQVIMPFGQYKGLLIEEIPSHYLRWGVRELVSCPDLAQAFQEELDRR